MRTSEKRKPCPSAANTGSRANIESRTCNSTLFREILSILVVGAMTGVMIWQSVFGMACDLASGPVVPISMAEVTDDR